MLRIVTLVSLMTPVALAGQSIAQDPTVQESIDAARLWLDAQKDYQQLPAITVAIVHDQELVWKEAFGMADTEGMRVAQTNSLHSICSISKLFTAVALMQLRDQGLVALRDPIEKHLPWYTVEQQFDDASPVTVEGILTHSAGLPRESDHPYWTGPEYPFPTKNEVISGLSNQETWYPTWSDFQYSNLGLSLAGYIVEAASGQEYHDYVRSNILEPLGMNDTYSEMPRQHIGGQLAMGYTGTNREGKRLEAPFFEARGIAPAAGYASTVEDLAKFASWQFRNRGDRNEILHGYTLAEMQRAHFIDHERGTTWGLGFSVRHRDNKTWVGHGGSCPGFRTALNMQNDEKIAVISFLNSMENAGTYANGVYDLLADAIRDAAKPDSSVATDDNGDGGTQEMDYTKYLGQYVGGFGINEVHVIPWRGGIATFGVRSTNPRQAITKLRHIEGDTFRRVQSDGELGRRVIFHTDDNGNVTRMASPINFMRKVG